MLTYTYYLTDGHEVRERREMTEAEAQAANDAARDATDGNWSWCRYSEPATESTFYLPGEHA